MNKGFIIIYNIKIPKYFSNKVQKKLSLLRVYIFIRDDEDVFHRLD